MQIIRPSAVIAIRFYQLLISPFLGNNCRFHPSCSEYWIKAVEKYGLGKGMVIGGKRLLRCHPWHPGGFDPLPDHTSKNK